MNRTVFEDYKKYSAEGGVWTRPGAFASAFRNAKDYTEPTEPTLEFEDSRSGGFEASVKVEGFSVVVEVKPSPENWFAMDGIGKFTSKRPPARYGSGRHTGYEVGVIDRFEGKNDIRRNEYRYFVPDESYEELYKHMRSVGLSKSEADLRARKQIKENFKLAERIVSGDIGEWDVLVRVYKKGVLLANGCIGLGVITSFRTEDRYINDTAWDCIGETLDEAKRTLKSLQEPDEDENDDTK